MEVSNSVIQNIQLKIGIVGATGAVGQQMIRLIENRGYRNSSFKLFASARSEGKTIQIFDRKYVVNSLDSSSFKNLDIVFFDASDSVSKEWVPVALESGCWVVDHSAAFRLESQTPLVVPEINFPKKLPSTRLLTGPNCSTVQLVMALRPIQLRWGLKRVVVSSYQSCSGAGAEGISSLEKQTRFVLDKKQNSDVLPFQAQIAFNCIPQIGSIQDNLYSTEELKIIYETRKILDLPQLGITATAVRVPTYFGHGESVNIETQQSFKIEEVAQSLDNFSGIRFYKNGYPMNLNQEKELSVGIGRLRIDDSIMNGLNLWIVADNLYKGAAWNALQIGEALFLAGVFSK